MIQLQQAFWGEASVEQGSTTAGRQSAAVEGGGRPQLVSIEEEELRGVSRTVAEIHWLLLLLVLLDLVFEGAHNDTEARAAITMGLLFYAALVMSFRYANFYKRESRWKIAIETWAMIAVVTWVLKYSGGMQSPLVSAYLLAV